MFFQYRSTNKSNKTLTLNCVQQVGLCFSRAAAMIINFNLLLVWIPMCKYSLTSLAFRANNLLNRLKRVKNERQKGKLAAASYPPSILIDLSLTKQQHHPDLSKCHKLYQPKKPSKLSSFESKFKKSLADAFDQLASWLYEAKLNFINSFLIAVDHCTSLHTICATTITIASGKLKVSHEKKLDLFVAEICTFSNVPFDRITNSIYRFILKNTLVRVDVRLYQPFWTLISTLPLPVQHQLKNNLSPPDMFAPI